MKQKSIIPCIVCAGDGAFDIEHELEAPDGSFALVVEHCDCDHCNATGATVVELNELAEADAERRHVFANFTICDCAPCVAYRDMIVRYPLDEGVPF